MSSVRRVIGSTGRPRFSSVNGLTDRVSMPRIGKLRLGEKAISSKGNAYPKETDYFRCDPDAHLVPEERQKILAKFAEVYGERPSVLRDTFFPSDDKEFVFPHPLEWWASSDSGAKLLCQGNGLEAVRLNVESGAWESRPCCQASDCREYLAGKCGLKARLRIFLPLITMSGYWQVDTGSQIGTGNILDVTNHLLTMFGRLTSIPLVLSREPQPVVFEGKANTHYILHLRAPNVDLQEFRELVAQNRIALPPADVDLEELDAADDVPEELIEDSVQQPAVNAELLAKIDAGFEILGTTKANREVSLHQFKGREEELLRKINEKVDKQNTDKGAAIA